MLDVFSQNCQVFENENKNKGQVRWYTFRNFACFSSYLQTKTFVWKQDCEIFKIPNTATLTKTKLLKSEICKSIQYVIWAI